jgi:hypothetical protein
MIPTPEKFAATFDEMRRAGTLTDIDREMLLCHYKAPGQSLTTGQMSSLMGWRGQYANRRYGELGRKLGATIPWVPTEREGFDGFHVSTLILGSRPDALFVWTLRPQLSDALERLGWVSPAEKNPEPLPPPARDGSRGVTERGRYLWQLTQERNSSASKLAKQVHGYRCQACGMNFEERYGDLGRNFIEAHHLAPLSQLDYEQARVYGPGDFAVLCSNCHEMIHRMQDLSDVTGLRDCIQAQERARHADHRQS